MCQIRIYDLTEWISVRDGYGGSDWDTNHYLLVIGENTFEKIPSNSDFLRDRVFNEYPESTLMSTRVTLDKGKVIFSDDEINAVDRKIIESKL